MQAKYIEVIHPASVLKSIFKFNIAIPFLDTLLQELCVMFTAKNCIAFRGFSILPEVVNSLYKEQITIGSKHSWKDTFLISSFDSCCTKHPPFSTKRKLDRKNVSKDFVLHNKEETNASTSTCQKAPVRIQRLDKKWKRDFLEFCKQYADDLPNLSFLSHEMDNWESAWVDYPDDKLPKTIPEALKLTNKMWFPNIYQSLKILAILPGIS